MCIRDRKGRVLISKTVDVANGLASVTFPFQGSDALSVNVQAKDDPSKTATVILQGSSLPDRQETTFSNFGTKIVGAMVATENSEAIRDIHFVRQGVTLCPVQIEPTEAGVRVTLGADLDELVIQTVNIGCGDAGRLTVHRKKKLTIDEQWDIEFEGPACCLGAAAFVDGKPWEQWGTFVKESSLSPSIEVSKPETVDERAKVKIVANGGSWAWVVVKDARLPSSESASLQLSRNMREHLKALNRSCDAFKALPAKRLQSLAGSLIAKGLISPEQLEDVKSLAKSMAVGLMNALVSRGYISSREAAIALAEYCRLGHVDLHNLELSESVIELMPESVARENCVIPLAVHADGTLIIAGADPLDIQPVENLRFILNRNIEIVVTTQEDIIFAINRHYGRIEGESADSILQEFTDTAVDFTETCELSYCLYDLEADDVLPRIEIAGGSTSASTIPKKKQPKAGAADKPGDVLFAKLVPMTGGVVEFELDPTDSNDEYLVSAVVFSAEKFDWVSVSDRFSLMPESFVELDLPKFIHHKDAAPGRVYFRSAVGDATVTVLKDDDVVATFETSASDVPEKESFLCRAGTYVATMEVCLLYTSDAADE